jgi:hypothetical protein
MVRCAMAMRWTPGPLGSLVLEPSSQRARALAAAWPAVHEDRVDAPTVDGERVGGHVCSDVHQMVVACASSRPHGPDVITLRVQRVPDGWRSA